MNPWNSEDKKAWFQAQSIKRSYHDEVVSKILTLQGLEIVQYGTLSLDPLKYPLFILKSNNYDKNKKTILITGGVHGYETSGVHGALAFMGKNIQNYEQFNFICAPCISPWGYETINRWNPSAIDPNRSFKVDSPAEECKLLLEALSPYIEDIFVHFDLHETTDTDNTVFRPAKAARDGVEEDFSEIPDGFYTVGDSENPCPEFQNAIIASVKNITHIAPPDENGNIIGAPLEQDGVINYPLKRLSLCAGLSNAKYTTTTEVYPDSPKVTPEICIAAQVAAICGGLNYIKSLF